MNICFVTSECLPFAKTGGLGDVSAALPSALAAKGHAVKLFMPLYDSVKVSKHGFIEAIELRKAEVKVLGSFDFINAERQARAHVDIVRIALRYAGRFSGDAPKVNPFDLWFDEFFKIDIAFINLWLIIGK